MATFSVAQYPSAGQTACSGSPRSTRAARAHSSIGCRGMEYGKSSGHYCESSLSALTRENLWRSVRRLLAGPDQVAIGGAWPAPLEPQHVSSSSRCCYFLFFLVPLIAKRYPQNSADEAVAMSSTITELTAFFIRPRSGCHVATLFRERVPHSVQFRRRGPGR